MTNNTAMDRTIDPPITINGINGATKLAKNINKIMNTNTIYHASPAQRQIGDNKCT